MRPRFVVLVTLLTAVMVVASAGMSSAVTPHYGLTINSTPNPIVTGDGVLVYGQLNGPSSGHQTIALYHRVNPAKHFTLVSSTTTNSFGFYEFPRADGVVLTNRSWFVTAAGLPGHVESRTVHELVAAALTLTPSSPTGDTSTPVTFNGNIAPPLVHVGERLYLQVAQGSSGDDWRTVKSGIIGSSSSYSIPYRFLVPGVYELRTAFRGDVRNIAAQSNPVSVTIQQAQNPLFTINTSAPIIDDGDAATISGVLSSAPTAPSTAPVPQAGVWVTLWAHRKGAMPTPVGSMITGTDGSYRFTVRPDHNVIYQATTTFSPPPRQDSAVLFQGVRNVVSIAASTTTGQVGQAVTFRGAVQPDKYLHVIYLQEQGKDGEFHTVAMTHVNYASAYQFSWTLMSPGNDAFRTLVPGGSDNVTGRSPVVKVAVALPTPQTLLSK